MGFPLKTRSGIGLVGVEAQIALGLSVGDLVGVAVGLDLGLSVGDLVGVVTRLSVGDSDGLRLG
jgi:hypothetical protein